MRKIVLAVLATALGTAATVTFPQSANADYPYNHRPDYYREDHPRYYREDIITIVEGTTQNIIHTITTGNTILVDITTEDIIHILVLTFSLLSRLSSDSNYFFIDTTSALNAEDF